MRKIFFVDYENMNGRSFDVITKDGIQRYDQVFLFFSKKVNKVEFSDLSKIDIATLTFIETQNGTPNSMDFCLMAHLGLLIEKYKRKEKEYIIVSKDNDYNSTIDFFLESGVNIRKLSDVSKELEVEELIETVTEIERETERELITKAFLNLNNIKQVDFVSMPSHVNQYTIKMLIDNWTSFWMSIDDYNKNPHKYKGKPKPPKYAKGLI